MQRRNRDGDVLAALAWARSATPTEIPGREHGRGLGDAADADVAAGPFAGIRALNTGQPAQMVAVDLLLVDAMSTVDGPRADEQAAPVLPRPAPRPDAAAHPPRG